MIKILIVDDEPDVELMFRQKFRNEIKTGEFFLMFALSAEQALSHMDTLEPFDILLVLSDINMPGMSGLELLKRIRSSYNDLKVFMISAYGDAHNQGEASRLGANDFITKPVDFHLLRERILNTVSN
jgi:CheY-like chemotaxis protein